MSREVRYARVRACSSVACVIAVAATACSPEAPGSAKGSAAQPNAGASSALATAGANPGFAGALPMGSGGTAGVSAGGAPSAGAVSMPVAAGQGGTPAPIAGAAGTSSSAGAAGAPFGARYPFPQNVRSARCTYPTGLDSAHARAAYERWKTEVVTADGAGGHLRVRRPNSPGGEVNSTVSEGIAYGMMLAVAMNDQPVFDSLWKYTQLWLNDNGLMHWYINAAGTEVLDDGAATDSDEDMAWALVLAHRQWGGSGSLSEPYLEAAKKQIDRIFEHEVDHSRNGLLLPGDSWGGTVIFNPSYFAPSEYRVFGVVSGNVSGWNQVIDTGYEMLAKCLNAAAGNEANGLVPAWCSTEGAPQAPFAGGETNYQYDSARMPFRIGQDYCYYGEPRAAAYLAKVSRFFNGIGAANIVDGYELDGRPHPDNATPAGSPQSAVFLGSIAVGAMHDAQYRPLIDDAYGRVATGELLARSRYYNLSWTALTLLMLSGNLVEFPQ